MLPKVLKLTTQVWDITIKGYKFIWPLLKPGNFTIYTYCLYLRTSKEPTEVLLNHLKHYQLNKSYLNNKNQIFGNQFWEIGIPTY